MRLSLAILTYNEIVGLRALFERIPRDSAEEILAVDGGSSDGSVEFLRERGIRVHGQAKRGRGEAFRVAFREASGDALIFFSPDGNEAPEDIPRFRPFLDQGFDLVVATRMTPDARNEEDDQILRWRKWANHGFNWLANQTWNRSDTYLTDSINGFRAITRSAWERMKLDGSGYTIEYQSSIRALQLGLRIAEFPTVESARLDGREGSPSIRTGVEFLKLYLSELKRSRQAARP